jgi:hypothetical protein
VPLLPKRNLFHLFPTQSTGKSKNMAKRTCVTITDKDSLFDSGAAFLLAQKWILGASVKNRDSQLCRSIFFGSEMKEVNIPRTPPRSLTGNSYPCTLFEITAVRGMPSMGGTHDSSVALVSCALAVKGLSGKVLQQLAQRDTHETAKKHIS